MENNCSIIFKTRRSEMKKQKIFEFFIHDMKQNLKKLNAKIIFFYPNVENIFCGEKLLIFQSCAQKFFSIL